MDDLPGFGPWQAVEMLGHGGMCAVFRAQHTGDPSLEAAVKVVGDPDEEAVHRFAAEARLLMSIDHPNVVKVFDVDEAHDPPWMSMQLLSGRDLDEERAALGAFEPERAARIVADLASGLAAIHALGVRHRDIKLANVMLGTDGVPRLIDFGIARRIEDTHKTRDGMVVGTTAYLAPEVYLGDDPREAQDTEASDVYALGQSLCELLTGRTVYDREGDTTTLVEIMRDKIARDGLDPREWRDTVPADLAEIVIEATRREPEDRLATAECAR